MSKPANELNAESDFDSHGVGMKDTMVRCLRLLVILAVCLTSRTSFSATQSNFVKIRLDRGVQVQIPRDWWLLGADIDRLMNTTVEAVIDLSGISKAEGSRTNLLAANSMPRTTYAAVRIDSVVPSSLDPSLFVAIGEADVRSFQEEMKKNIEKMLPLQNYQLVEFLGSRIDHISRYPVIVTEYRRSGPHGTVLVQTNQIFTQSQEVHVNLSYRESEAAIWKPVIGRIRQSLVLK